MDKQQQQKPFLTGEVCSTCGKQIGSGKARSDVTRFLFWESRCTCVVPANELVLKLIAEEAQRSEQPQSSQVPSIPEQVAKLLGERYEVIALIGQGGMGSVYKVRDVQLDKLFAVKVLNAHLVEDQAAYKRFEQEAKAASELTHANVVALYQFSRSETGAPFIVMDYLDGQDLSTVIKSEGYLDVPRALDIGIQAAEALAHAHMKGIVHRDIKPSNIFLLKTPGGMDYVKLVDFGIAKVAGNEQAGQHLTQTGEVFGSPLYMSPEQCLGNKLDARSDIYSLGCVLHEALTGKPPFAGQNPIKTILSHINDAPIAVSKAGSQANEDLEKIVLRCLEKEPANRYQSADDLAFDLSAVKSGQAIKPAPPKKAAPRERKPSRVLAAVALGVPIVAVAVALVVAFMNQPGHLPGAIKSQKRAETYEGKNLVQWTALIEKDPDNADLYVDRGILHDMRDERTNAVDDFTRALELEPDNYWAYVRRSSVNNMLANYSDALADANKLIELYPDADRPYEARAFVESATEQYDDAIADLDRAIKSAENQPQPDTTTLAYEHYYLSCAYLKLSRFDRALAEINEAIRLEPRNAAFLTIRGFIHLCRQNLNQADSDLEAATKLDDARGVEWQILATARAQPGAMNEALALSKQAMELETFPARGYRLRGEMFRSVGMNNEALQDLSSSTSLEAFPPGYRQRAYVYMNLNQPRSALSDLRKSLKLNPNSALTRAFAAMVEDQLGMKKESDADLKAAFQVKSIPAMVYVHRAAIRLNNGDSNGALADANQALKMDPFLREAYEMRANIYRKLNNEFAAKADAFKASRMTRRIDL
ncbi:MAG: protein kinase [Candidatus Obscuribacterales bacterium]